MFILNQISHILTQCSSCPLPEHRGLKSSCRNAKHLNQFNVDIKDHIKRVKLQHKRWSGQPITASSGWNSKSTHTLHSTHVTVGYSFSKSAGELARRTSWVCVVSFWWNLSDLSAVQSHSSHSARVVQCVGLLYSAYFIKAYCIRLTSSRLNWSI